MNALEEYVEKNVACGNNSGITGGRCTIILQVAKKEKARYGYLFLKRLFDMFCSALALVLLMPVFLITVTAIKLDSKGPAIFSHKRIGKNKTDIKLYKFRTMVHDAENLIAKFTPEQKMEFERNFKLEDDPRITKIGKFLRKTSMDEFPQLINILRGDISIVGPRPVTAKELDKYGDEACKLLSVKPGLTGYWQINGRSCTTYDERIKMELYYVEHASIWLDLKIILNTVPAVLTGRGAY